jgi:glycosyltransferase involved in cell wall biosynthesis
MPIYNGQRFLAAALESVLGQSFGDFEILAIDDGSTDASLDILDDFRIKDSRVKVISQPHLGYTTALNAGIKNASRDLIAMMDGDDLMMPNRLDRQLWFMRANADAAVVCSYAYLIDIRDKIIGTSQTEVDVERGIAERAPRLFSEIVNPSVLMRKADVVAVGGYRESFTFAPDRDLWARLVTSGYRIKCQPEFLLGYRLHLSALSAHTMHRNALFATYSDVNFVRRLRSEPEITFDEFLQQRRARPLLRRFNDWRFWTALMYFKRATRYRGERRWIGCARSLTIAVLLAPLYIVRRALLKSTTGN